MNPPVGATLCSISPWGGRGFRCWSNLEPPHSCPYPRGLKPPQQTDSHPPPNLGHFNRGGVFFFVVSLIIGDVWAFPTHLSRFGATCLSCATPYSLPVHLPLSYL